jgi:transposase-like protein
MDGDVFKAMIEVMAERVMEEELARHLGAGRHERTPERSGARHRTNRAYSQFFGKLLCSHSGVPPS